MRRGIGHSSLHTLDEVAAVLRVSTRTARRIVACGELPAVHVGRLVRVRDDDLRRFIAERTTTAAEVKRSGRAVVLAAGDRLWD